MVLTLIEYAWDGSKFRLCGTLELDPGPNTIEKDTKVEWRARHTGLYSLYPRCKYRFRRTVEYTLKGGCTPEKRREIEFYVMRFSKFKLGDDWGEMGCPNPYSTRDTSPYYHPWSEEIPDLDTYVMISEATFTLEEEKEWCTYTLKLRVVNTEEIEFEPP